jgi:hypothetical protein
VPIHKQKLRRRPPAQSRHQFCQNLGTAFENPDLPHRATPTALGEIVAL